MKHLKLAFLAIGIVSTLAVAASKHEFTTGKLLDIGSQSRLVDGTTYRWVTFTVQLDDLVYVARGDRMGRNATSAIALALSRSGDSGQDLVVGDPNRTIAGR